MASVGTTITTGQVHVHGILMTVGYAGFLPLATLAKCAGNAFDNETWDINRRARWHRMWWLIHVTLATIGFAATWVGFGWVIQAMRNANEFHFRSGHDLVGLIIQMALVAVPLMGLLTALYYARGGQFKLGVRPGRALTTLRSIAPWWLPMFHQIMAYTVLVSSFVVIFSGIGVARAANYWSWWTNLIIGGWLLIYFASYAFLRYLAYTKSAIELRQTLAQFELLHQRRATDVEAREVGVVDTHQAEYAAKGRVASPEEPEDIRVK